MGKLLFTTRNSSYYTNMYTSIKPIYTATSNTWKGLRKKVEDLIRKIVFGSPRYSTRLGKEITFSCLGGRVEITDAHYQKCMKKISSNFSTWKYEVIDLYFITDYPTMSWQLWPISFCENSIRHHTALNNGYA